ncbi:hypothetical protein Ae406Ps2_6016c [Pseudonocardia sp. Ae406_Ps2]|nr:hypothetical protein Ae406Ps2_6016c [Pseudonocardia sp. Ae406_Ps2]
MEGLFLWRCLESGARVSAVTVRRLGVGLMGLEVSRIGLLMAPDLFGFM